MMSFVRGIGLALTAVLWLVGAAAAVENLDSGKTGAQLFASDCAGCHKNPTKLGKAGGLFGLSGYLSEHYTASSQSASAIAAYLESLGKARGPSGRAGATKRAAKGDDKAKAGDTTAGTGKSGEDKPRPLAGPRSSNPNAPRPPENVPSQPKAN